METATPANDEKKDLPAVGADSDSGTESNNGNKNESLQLPRATITKIINELLPPGIACPKETRELLMQCCIEFIHLVTGEANDLCETSGKKTISPEHILESLKMLGFGDYCAEADAARTDFEEAQKHKRQGREKGKDLMEKSGLSESELLRQQEELFEAARQRYLSSNATTPVSTPQNANNHISPNHISNNNNSGNSANKTISESNSVITEDDDADEIKSGTKPL